MKRATLPVCPCCGRPVSGIANPVMILELVDLTPIQRKILRFMADRFGRWIETPTLVSAAYDDRPDGGPLTAMKAVDVQIFDARKRLAGTPLRIETARSARGRRLTWSAA